jgi:glycosyltransferase involved in cell wall biosynthesis
VSPIIDDGAGYTVRAYLEILRQQETTPLKILYHHRTVSNDGQGIHIRELISAFRRRGHEVRVVGPAEIGIVPTRNDGRALKRWRDRAPAWGAEIAEMTYSIAAYRHLRRAVRHWRPDVLYERYSLFNLAGSWLRRRYAIPRLLEVNSPLAEERQRFGRLCFAKLANSMERNTWLSADLLLPVTHVLAERAVALGVPATRIRVVPNGIDPRRFEQLPDVSAAKVALDLEGCVVLGFVGFAREWHGLDRLIDVMTDTRHTPDLRLVIAGEGPALDSLRRQAGEAGIAERIKFLGHVPWEDIPAIVSAFDIAVQPNVVAYASPLKIFEYMAAGRAIVAPSTANIREVLEDRTNALLFDPGQPDSLKARILELYDEPETRRALGSQARREVEVKKLTWDHNAAAIDEALKAILRP